MGGDDDAEADGVQNLELMAVDDDVVQGCVKGDGECLTHLGPRGDVESVGHHVVGAYGHGVPPHPAHGAAASIAAGEGA